MFGAALAALLSAPMPPTQPDPIQVDPAVSSSDTITTGPITNSQAVAIGAGAVAKVFQQVLQPAPSDYRYAALRMIEEYEEDSAGSLQSRLKP